MANIKISGLPTGAALDGTEVIPLVQGGVTIKATAQEVADLGGDGTVTTVSVTTANGVSGSVATATTTPAITLTLGAITPTSVAASGTVTGSNLSGTNTGNQTISASGDVSAAGSTGNLSTTVNSVGGSSAANVASATTVVNASGVSSAELGYVVGVTSAIQTQLNAKQATGNYVTALTGDVTAAGPGSSAATIPVGTVTDTKASLAVKPAVAVVATTNQTLSGFPVIDGITPVANTLVLLTAQSTGSQNGPWQAQVGAWTRPSWYPSGGTAQAFAYITTLVRLGTTYAGSVWRSTTTAPITIDTTATTWVVTKMSLNAATATQSSATSSGYLSSADWSTFNAKADNITGNFITNPDAEVNLTGWNLYNNSGNPAFASVVAQDITWTAATGGNAGNGIDIQYVYNAGFPAATPNINVVSGTVVQVQWNNGPTVASNPTATQLKAAWDAVPAAVAIATAAITGTAGNRQYITGSNITANGGDAAPVSGTGGVTAGVTLTRNTTTPLVGTASFDLGKSAANEQGQGVSTDFTINNADKGQRIQVSFYYTASAGMVLGSSSDVKMFIYDVTNAVLLPISPTILAGPVSTTKTYVGTFTAAANSVSYRLILHIATSSATAWDLIFDKVVATDIVTPGAATQVPTVAVLAQPISGAVTDRMVVMWLDGGSAWVPATITGATVTDTTCLLGFATNIVGLLADIVVAGSLGGFSIGPFVGFNQYIDNIAGGISPLPSPFTDNYVSVGKGISSSVIDIQFSRHTDAIGVKGGLLTNSGVNDGTGDTVLAVGSNGNVLVANSAAANGINWAPAVVAGTGLTYTTATRGLALAALAGDVTGAPQTNTIAAATVTGKVLTGYVSGSGVVAATDTILQGINKLNGNTALKANIAAPTLTGDVTLSTGNLLISTIGKGPQVKTGANAKIGTAVLVGGTVTVANTSVTANSRIFLTSNTDGGTPGWLRVSAKTNATSFVITSSSGTDTSTVAWYMVESIP